MSKKTRAAQKAEHPTNNWMRKGLLYASLIAGLGYFGERIHNHHIHTPKYLINQIADGNYGEQIGKLEHLVMPGQSQPLDVTPQDRAIILDAVYKGANFTPSQVESVDFSKSTSVQFISLEQDPQRISRAKILGKDAIDHMFGWLDSPYARLKPYDFNVPSGLHEVLTSSEDKEWINIVAATGYLGKYVVSVKLKDGRVADVKADGVKPIQAEASMVVTFFAQKVGYRVSAKDSPVYASTLCDKSSAILGFPIEMLHRAVRKYTMEHLTKEASKLPHTNQALDALTARWIHREETVVHAIGLPWVKEYQKKLGIDISFQVNNTYSLYNNNDARYSDVNSFVKTVEQLGPRQVLELYATNPDKLFSK